MKLFRIFILLLLSTSSIAQIFPDDQYPYLERFQSIDSLIRLREYKKAEQQGVKFYHDYLDQSLPFITAFYATISRWSMSEEDELFDDDLLYDSLEIRLEGYVDTVALRFPEVDFAQLLVAGFYDEIDEFELASAHLEQQIIRSDFFLFYNSLLDRYLESDKLEDLKRIEILAREKGNSDIVFKRILIDHYIKKDVLDSARVLSEDMLGSPYVLAIDYYQSASINFAMNNKFQACEDLRNARRKGYWRVVPWEERLNCFNEDRTNPIAKEFDTKMRTAGILTDSPLKINRKDWNPPFEKRYTYKSNLDEEQLTLVSTRYYSPRNEGGFIYYSGGGRRSFYELKLRMFSVYPNEPWQNRKGDTLYFSRFASILPVEFEMNKSIFVERDIGDLMEYTYLGSEIITLESGQKVTCAKMRMARWYDGFIQEVDYYWFANKRGWVASEAMDGTRVEVVR